MAQDTVRQSWEIDKVSNSAHAAVNFALKKGALIRPDVCELCGRHTRSDAQVPTIVAHHYKGYGYPLDIWWICRVCNKGLGQNIDITREQAVEFLAHRSRRPTGGRSKEYEAAACTNNSNEQSAYEYLLDLIAEAGSDGVVIGGKRCYTLEQAEAALAEALGK